MKPIFATLLASALATAVSGAYAHPDNTDLAQYKVTSQTALADHQRALKQCKELSGAAENVCIEQAKVAQAQAEQDATLRYNNTLEARTAARTALAKAEYALERARCAVMTGADEEKCMNRALAARTEALADAKADRAIVVASTKEQTLAQKAENAAERAAAKTAAAARTVAEKTEKAAETTMAKADRMAENAAAKTERAYDKAAAKTEHATEKMAVRTDRALDKAEVKTERMASKTGQMVADSVITTKLKAGLLAEPDLSGLSIHVETEKGVVMLSGFVESKENAEQAVRMAREVDGVTKVRSSLLVK